MDGITGVADVIIGKQRHGPTGTVSLHFDANLTKFTNLVRPGYTPDFRD
jgi:replicative DNA helicase